MGAIFISHSSKDDSVAAELKHNLAAQGHRSVFLDFDPELGIPAGRDWEQELYQQLRNCQAVIVLCSEHSMSSRWCFAEITHAKSLGKHLFPVKVSPCTIDPVLTSRQIIDLTQNQDDAYQRLWRGLEVAGLDLAGNFDCKHRSPYPGMMAFQEKDAAVYFGPETEIQQGLETLQRLRQFGGARALLWRPPTAP
ncbi:MAG: toll/interleukin-1 receptor domain-containing protein [Deltaproteobacteria bacterium]|nr:toll/interleukin-1 receptor domain-containing protein [Deltaproteobacteria bacterium]